MVLYSHSGRRVELLLRMGINPQICPVNIDERMNDDIAPTKAVELLALKKLAAGMQIHPESMDEWGLAADTMVEGPTGILGKPADEKSATAMIQELSGRTHKVHSSIAVCRMEKGKPCKIRSLVHTSKVRFRKLSTEEIRSYIRTGEWMDAAGGYKIQDRGALLIEHIDGLYSTVMGLPLSPLYGILSAMDYPFGWIQPGVLRRG